MIQPEGRARPSPPILFPGRFQRLGIHEWVTAVVDYLAVLRAITVGAQRLNVLDSIGRSRRRYGDHVISRQLTFLSAADAAVFEAFTECAPLNQCVGALESALHGVTLSSVLAQLVQIGFTP